MSASNQFRLLRERRFLPFFGAQALGAFNDNVYRNVLVLLVTFGGTLTTRLSPEILTNLAGGLFILPYLLFSGLAGQLADRFEKSRVVQVVKASEILIMALAGIGLASGNIVILSCAQDDTAGLRHTSFEMFHYDAGLFLTQAQMGVDVRRRQPRCFVSHAHTDHIAGTSWH